jgi:hypothetical protein
MTVPRLIQIYDCIELLPTRRISIQKANKINYTIAGGARNPSPNGIFKE